MQPEADKDALRVTSERPEQRALEILSALSYRTGELGPYLQEIAQGLSELLGLDWSTITLCRDGPRTCDCQTAGRSPRRKTFHHFFGIGRNHRKRTFATKPKLGKHHTL
jgi:hypothetical protein